MTFTALIAVCALFGLLFFIAAIRRLRRRRVLGGMAHGAAALIFLLAAVCAVLIGTNLRSYQGQVDARVLKWHAFANLVGFDAAYRLERISGRYSHLEDERSLPRTVYDLHEPGRIDPWELVHRYRSWVPWLDALYGSATFLPMADGALYEIKVSQSGLVARPLNQAAREAVGSWH